MRNVVTKNNNVEMPCALSRRLPWIEIHLLMSDIQSYRVHRAGPQRAGTPPASRHLLPDSERAPPGYACRDPGSGRVPALRPDDARLPRSHWRSLNTRKSYPQPAIRCTGFCAALAMSSGGADRAVIFIRCTTFRCSTGCGTSHDELRRLRWDWSPDWRRLASRR